MAKPGRYQIVGTLEPGCCNPVCLETAHNAAMVKLCKETTQAATRILRFGK